MASCDAMNSEQIDAMLTLIRALHDPIVCSDGSRCSATKSIVHYGDNKVIRIVIEADFIEEADA